MTEVRLAVDVSHHRSIPLFSMKTSLRDFIKQPKSTLNELKRLTWRTPLQSLVLHIFRPLKVKKSHSKNIKIGLFPYLKTRYFIWTLSLFKKFSLQFSLGNYNKHHFWIEICVGIFVWSCQPVLSLDLNWARQFGPVFHVDTAWKFIFLSAICCLCFLFWKNKDFSTRVRRLILFDLLWLFFLFVIF